MKDKERLSEIHELTGKIDGAINSLKFALESGKLNDPDNLILASIEAAKPALVEITILADRHSDRYLLE